VSGVYTLKKRTKVGSSYRIDTLLENYEVYNLGPDPKEETRYTRILFDALNFSNNQYSVATLDSTYTTAVDVENSIHVVQGLTGTLKTLIIMPEDD